MSELVRVGASVRTQSCVIRVVVSRHHRKTRKTYNIFWQCHSKLYINAVLLTLPGDEQRVRFAHGIAHVPVQPFISRCGE